mgnify:FL=1
MRKHQIIWVSALVIILALGAWFFVKQRRPAPRPESKQYEKNVVISAETAKKLPPSIHPLIYRFLLGMNPEVQRATVLKNPTGGPVSLVVYSVASTLPVLREEFKDFFVNTRWNLKEVDRGGQFSLFAERTPERVTVILVPSGSGTSVTLSYVGGPTPRSSP